MLNINYDNIGKNKHEQRAIDEVQRLFSTKIQGAQVLTNVILPTHSDLKTCPATAEYDIIVVCEYGLIHFEIKSWSGSKLFNSPGKNNNSRWFVEFDNKTVLERPNALRQCAGKTKMLRRELGVFTQHFVLFTNNDLDISTRMSPHLFTLEQASYLPRFIRMRHKESQSIMLDQAKIKAITEVLQEASHGITPVEHLQNIEKYLLQKKQYNESKNRANSQTFQTHPTQAQVKRGPKLTGDDKVLDSIFKDYSRIRPSQGFWKSLASAPAVSFAH